MEEIRQVKKIKKGDAKRIFEKVSLLKSARLAWGKGENIITTIKRSRVGSWMSKAEYQKMVKTSQLQKRSGGITHILLEGKEHYRDIAGKMYVEFDIPKNTTITRGSGKGWGIFYEKGSPRWKLYNKKGLDVSQPKVSNIKIIDRNGL
ncbi:TreTu family toxin [Candidatus Ornithobacterium hominis]|uniref:TreTu family toxin n=1 Tax=Candidatus Ornithobacterium hominis TaxID=2497989 RepID=UPI003EBFD424